MSKAIKAAARPIQPRLFTGMVTPETAAAITYLESQGLPLGSIYGYMNAVDVAAKVKERIILEAAS